MPNIFKHDAWKHRRVRWPVLGLLALCLTTAVALMRSHQSRVVVYNETGGVIAELTVSACGQSQTFRNVDDGESVQFALQAGPGHSDIAIATNGCAMSRGEYIEPRGGYRALVRLCRDGEIEFSTSLSYWQNLISSPLAFNP